MEIKVLRGDVTSVKTPALIVNLFQGVKSPEGATGAVDKALDGAISELISDGEIKGKRGELTLIHTFGKIGPARVLVVGLGSQDKFTADTVREVMGDASRYLRGKGITSACTIAHGAGIAGLEPNASAQAMAEGAFLGLYRFKQYQSGDDDASDLSEMTVVEDSADRIGALEEGLRTGRIIAEGVMLSRDMSNTPANDMTPTRMSEIARQVADAEGLDITVLERKDMEELGMGALVGVAKGSHQPPKLIALRYTGDPDNPDKVLGLVGKGITFDTGGISLKAPGGMENMKGDMTGGSSVIGAMQAIARLQPKVNVTAVVPTTENMPGGEAQRPGDIVKAMNGKTIEVINTDAEGRLVLSDAMVYAKEKLGVSRIVDVATLTGAITVSLGKVRIGVFGNDQEWVDQVLSAGNGCGERMWQMPMDDDYKEQIKSNVADMMNVGGREAGSITAAKFLAEFTEGLPWVHLDIAGTYRMDANKGWFVKGSSGGPVRTLVNLALAEGS